MLVGPALILTSVVLACGLAVTVFSDLPSLRTFGWLSAFAMIAALIGGPADPAGRRRCSSTGSRGVARAARRRRALPRNNAYQPLCRVTDITVSPSGVVTFRLTTC